MLRERYEGRGIWGFMEDFHYGNQLKLRYRQLACFNGQLRLCLLFVLEGNGGVRDGVEGSSVE